MGFDLPVVLREDFEARLFASGGANLSHDQMALLYLHYQELRKWNRRVSMVGPVDKDAVVERHYGESLAANAFLEGRRGVLVDIGSGAGFPGFVLAVSCPDIEVVLTESRARKWSFLKSVCRRAGLSTVCLNARVGADSAEELPTRIDWITSRAVRFEELGLDFLMPKLTNRGAILYWAGAAEPALPDGLTIFRQFFLAGSTSRRILEIVKASKTSS